MDWHRHGIERLNFFRSKLMSGTKRITREIKVADDDARLHYHLTSLYALKPIPDELLQLVGKVAARIESRGMTNDNT
jgi:hypothetical protein